MGKLGKVSQKLTKSQGEVFEGWHQCRTTLHNHGTAKAMWALPEWNKHCHFGMP
jgi:hypothetical protein